MKETPHQRFARRKAGGHAIYSVHSPEGQAAMRRMMREQIANVEDDPRQHGGAA